MVSCLGKKIKLDLPLTITTLTKLLFTIDLRKFSYCDHELLCGYTEIDGVFADTLPQAM